MFRLLKNRDFRLLWVGGFISMLGDWALIAALPFEIYRRTGSPLATGAVFIAAYIPAILLGSTAGVFVDRWDRRRLMVLVNIGLALSLAPLFALDLTGIWICYAVLFVSSALEQLFIPAEVALLPQLVGQEHLVSANSLSSLNRNLARLIGPAVGGLAIAVGGLGVAVVIDIASFLVAAVLIGLIGPGRTFQAERALALDAASDVANTPPTRLGKLVTEWREGISLSTSHPMLRAIIVFTLLTSIGEGILAALLVPWMSDILHGDEYAWAALLSSQALGGLIGALFVGRFFGKVSPALLLGIGTVVFAFIDFAIFTYPLVVPLVLPALIGMVIVGIPISAMGVGSTTLQQSLTTDSHRGRVAGLMQTIFAIGVVSGTIVSGLLAPAIGIIPLMALDPILYLGCGILVLITARRLRREDRAVELAKLEPDAA